MNVKLDSESAQRLTGLAAARGQSAEVLAREAIAQYLEREERVAAGEHPSGKPWPKRHTVGGIITPV